MEQLNIYMKMQKAVVDLQNTKLKKSGWNSFGKYPFFELKDFLPTINNLCLKYKLYIAISFTVDLATMTIYNAEKPDETIVITVPKKEIELKATNAMQSEGGTQTFARRYLYMSAFHIVENDMFDSTSGQPENAPYKTRPTKSGPFKSSQTKVDELYMKIDGYAMAKGLDPMSLKSNTLKKKGKASFKEFNDAELNELIKAFTL